jgi:hypothetical protein
MGLVSYEQPNFSFRDASPASRKLSSFNGSRQVYSDYMGPERGEASGSYSSRVGGTSVRFCH